MSLDGIEENERNIVLVLRIPRVEVEVEVEFRISDWDVDIEIDTDTDVEEGLRNRCKDFIGRIDMISDEMRLVHKHVQNGTVRSDDR